MSESHSLPQQISRGEWKLRHLFFEAPNASGVIASGNFAVVSSGFSKMTDHGKWFGALSQNNNEGKRPCPARWRMKDVTKTGITREQLLALLQGGEALRALLQATVQEVLEAEMHEALGATKGERSGRRARLSQWLLWRELTTRMARWSCGCRRIAAGCFAPTCSLAAKKRCCWRSPKFMSKASSTRNVCAVTDELCGRGFGASAVSSVTVQLDAALERFMRRQPTEDYAYLILDARYERVREAGVDSQPRSAGRPSASTGRVAAKCSRWNWPPARARVRGATS